MFSRKPKPLPAPVLTPQPSTHKDSLAAAGIHLGDDCYWNPTDLPNGHVVAIGASGSGKTQTIKALAYELRRTYPEMQVILIDFHGDQKILGEIVYPLHMASPHGINPLAVNLDPEGGGPNLQAIAATRTLKKALALGPNQEGKLLEIIKACYLKREIVQEKPETLTLEPPNFADIEEEINRRSIETATAESIQSLAESITPHELPCIPPPERSGIYFLLQGEKVAYIGASMNLANRIKGKHHVLRQIKRDVSIHWYELVGDWEQLLRLETAMIKRFKPPFNNIELQPKCKESEKLRLKLAATFQYGIFSRPQPQLTQKLIRIDLSKLPPALGAIAAESLAHQLMNQHRLTGEIAGKLPRTYLFIDEAKEMPRGEGSACNRLIADGRKYGLALVLASQSERHLSLDAIGNSATKIVLPVDQTEVKKVSAKFRFAENRVALLRPLLALCRFGTRAEQVSILPYYQRVQNDESST